MAHCKLKSPDFFLTAVQRVSLLTIMGHSLQIPFSVLSILLFFCFFSPQVELYPDDNKLLQFFCQLTTWSNLYTLSYLKLTKIPSKRYHYLHLSKEEIEEIEGGEIICPKYKSIQNQDLISGLCESICHYCK